MKDVAIIFGWERQLNDPLIKVSLDVIVTPELRLEGLARDVIRAVQNARKEAGLSADDRIALILESDVDHELHEAIVRHRDLIMDEAKAISLDYTGAGESEPVKAGSHELRIALVKA